MNKSRVYDGVRYSVPRHVIDWTADRVETLRRMWAAGNSAREIAAAIGGDVTRAAVIGKANRLRIADRTVIAIPTGQTSTPPRRSAFALAEFDPVIRRAVAAWTNEISKTHASNEQDEGQDD